MNATENKTATKPPKFAQEDDEDGFPAGATKERPKRKVNGEAKPEERAIPVGESAFALVERDIPDPVRLCDPWAIEGVNLIAGRPKLGKTTLVRQKMAAAVVGADYLDSSFPNPIRCAFLSLEEGELLCRAKFKMAGFSDEALAGIQLHFDWPRGREGADMLDRYLHKNPEIHYVAVDSLTRFRVVPDARMPPFMADYEAMSDIHAVSKNHPGRCIDVIHHTRKARSEDAIDEISGTYGLTAACDSYLVMRHHADGAMLHAGGRLWTRNDSEYRIKRSASNHRWEMIGANSGLTDEQEQTLAIVKASPVGMSGAALSEKLNITRQSAWGRLDGLLAKGVVEKKFGKVFAK